MTQSKSIRVLWAAILAVFAPAYLYLAVAFGIASLIQFLTLPSAPHSWIVLLIVMVGIIGGGMANLSLVSLVAGYIVQAISFLPGKRK